MSPKIWHNRFENDWMRAFPLGNGRIGAMVYGNPHKEQIEINEEFLWAGRQIKEKYSASPEKLAEIRGLLFEHKFQEAAKICKETFLANPSCVRAFQSFGNIFIDFYDKTPYTDYRKELELSDAITTVSYGKCDAKYTSEIFISEKYDALVYKVCAGGARFSCNITMEREQDAYTSTLDNSTIVLNGRIINKSDELLAGGNVKCA